MRCPLSLCLSPSNSSPIPPTTFNQHHHSLLSLPQHDLSLTTLHQTSAIHLLPSATVSVNGVFMVGFTKALRVPESLECTCRCFNQLPHPMPQVLLPSCATRSNNNNIWVGSDPADGSVTDPVREQLYTYSVSRSRRNIGGCLPCACASSEARRQFQGQVTPLVSAYSISYLLFFRPQTVTILWLSRIAGELF